MPDVNQYDTPSLWLPYRYSTLYHLALLQDQCKSPAARVIIYWDYFSHRQFGQNTFAQTEIIRPSGGF